MYIYIHVSVLGLRSLNMSRRTWHSGVRFLVICKFNGSGVYGMGCMSDINILVESIQGSNYV